MAHPATEQIAAHREELSMVEALIRIVEVTDDPDQKPAETSLQSEKRKWRKKLDGEAPPAA